MWTVKWMGGDELPKIARQLQVVFCTFGGYPKKLARGNN
jgi:hypothetical protein